MPICETDISIIIPTYLYQDKVGRAVRSALASGAGEIIVIDDHSNDGTVEMLMQYDDPRLKVIENPVNLGLWENHLAGLSSATRLWIKFLQADDYLTDGGLTQFAQAADADVSVVWSCAIMEEESTGERTCQRRITTPWRVTTQELFRLCLETGWLLGRPSDVLLRADCIERDPAAWVTNISSDLVVGILAATRGDIVLLPHGAIVNVNHDSQDARTQGPGRGFARMVKSAQFLHARDEAGLAHFAAEWAAINLPFATRCALAAAYRRQMAPTQVAGLLVRYGMLAAQAYRDATSRMVVSAARRYRQRVQGKPDIDERMTELRNGLT